MKKFVACAIALVMMVSLFSVSASAAIKIKVAEDVDFDKFYHITPVSATIDSCIATDVDDPMRIFDNSIESAWYENQLKSGSGSDTSQTWEPGTKITAKFDKAYPITGVRCCSGDYSNRVRIIGVKISFFNAGSIVDTTDISFEEEAHLAQFFKFDKPVTADSVTIQMTYGEKWGCQWWGESWAYLSDVSFYTSDKNVPLETELYTDSYFAYGVDISTFTEYIPYVLPKSVTCTNSSKGEDPMDAFYKSLIFMPNEESMYNSEFWTQPLPDKAKDLAKFTVKYDKAYEIRGFDIIPGVATWDMGYEYCADKSVKPTTLKVTFKNGGKTVDSVVIYLDWDRLSSAAYDMLSFQLSQYYVLNRTVTADELYVEILGSSENLHDDLDEGANLLGLTKFGAVGNYGDVPEYWTLEWQSGEKTSEDPTEAPTDAPTEKPTEAPTEKPTEAPTDKPTEAPTDKPTEAPTDKPTEAPTDAPTDEQPTGEQPTDEQPTGEQPTDEQPTDEQPTGEQPTDEQPTDEQPTDEQPTDESTDAPTDAPTDPSKTTGCNSAVISSAAIALVAMAAVILRKKED